MHSQVGQTYRKTCGIFPVISLPENDLLQMWVFHICMFTELVSPVICSYTII